MWDLSSLNRDQIHIPCIARWILNLWATSKVPIFTFYFFHLAISATRIPTPLSFILSTCHCYLILSILPFVFLLFCFLLFFYHHYPSTRSHQLYPGLLLFHSVQTLLLDILPDLQLLHISPINLPKTLLQLWVNKTWNLKYFPLLSSVVADNNFDYAQVFMLKSNVICKGIRK